MAKRIQSIRTEVDTANSTLDIYIVLKDTVTGAEQNVSYLDRPFTAAQLGTDLKADLIDDFADIDLTP